MFIAILFKQKKGFLSKRFPISVDNKGRIKGRESYLNSWPFINYTISESLQISDILYRQINFKKDFCKFAYCVASQPKTHITI